MNECRVCNNAKDNGSFVAREMMFGFGDEFRYLECSDCGCLQIADAPTDLSKYYPDFYYAFDQPARQTPLKRSLKRRRARAALGRRDYLGKLLVTIYGAPKFVPWLAPTGIGFEDSILDVGCGRGKLLLEMHASGFTDLTGVDPYVEGDVDYGSGVRVFNSELSDYVGRHDFVMLHHAFEHMSDPVASLEQLYRIVKPGGGVLIRTPVAGSHAWRTYGPDWAQIDAPRHQVIHTEKSIEICANKAGFDVVDTIYDSTALQFWASEQYRRGIALRDENSYDVNPQRSPFSEDEIRAFQAEADRLNAAHDGDQASFYLRRR